jgi:hypothetical protein
MDCTTNTGGLSNNRSGTSSSATDWITSPRGRNSLVTFRSDTAFGPGFAKDSMQAEIPKALPKSPAERMDRLQYKQFAIDFGTLAPRLDRKNMN